MKKLLLTFLLFLFVFSVFAQKKKNDDRRIKLAGIPMVSYNRTVDLIGGLLLSGYYKINKKDTISPLSSTSFIGMYTSNNSYFGAAIQQFYLNDDSWRIKLMAGFGNANLQVYSEFGESGKYYDYESYISTISLDVKRKIFNDFYFGLSGGLAKVNTTFDFPGFDSYKDKQTLNSAGFNFLYDSRSNVNYPINGIQAIIDNKFFQDWMGNDSSFALIELAYTHYIDIKGEQQILLFRYFSQMSFGEVPFQGQNVVRGDDIRGYSKGKYRNNQIYTIQSEYRYKFKNNNFGFVAFAGVAAAVPDFNGLLNTTYLPGIGVGVRYRILKKEKINIGIDVGVGKDDWSLTFRVGDAFSK